MRNKSLGSSVKSHEVGFVLMCFNSYLKGLSARCQPDRFGLHKKRYSFIIANYEHKSSHQARGLTVRFVRVGCGATSSITVAVGSGGINWRRIKYVWFCEVWWESGNGANGLGVVCSRCLRFVHDVRSQIRLLYAVTIGLYGCLWFTGLTMSIRRSSG